MSGEFDLSKDKESTKLEQRPQILVNLSSWEFSDLTGLPSPSGLDLTKSSI